MTKRAAVEQMIHAAMLAHDKNQHAVAISLAAAAEGAMPPARGEKTLFDLMREAGRAYGVNIVSDINAQRDWLKHHNDHQPDRVEIDEGSSLLHILRCVSKYRAVYGQDGETREMQDFFAVARQFEPED